MAADAAAPPRYGPDYYDSLRAGMQRSASVVVPALVQLFRPKSVLDVGCGTGVWLAAFHDLGIKDFLGLDGPWIDEVPLELPREHFRQQDLSLPIRLERTFDLVLSLEVAEHLPAEAAGPFVQSLATLGSIVIFSAAIPFQRGEGHVNERWPRYWVDLFAANGFRCLDILRGPFWDQDEVEVWYRQNMLCFAAQAVAGKIARAAAREPWQARPLEVVHPGLYEALVRENSEWRRYVDSLRSELESIKGSPLWRLYSRACRVIWPAKATPNWPR